MRSKICLLCLLVTRKSSLAGIWNRMMQIDKSQVCKGLGFAGFAVGPRKKAWTKCRPTQWFSMPLEAEFDTLVSYTLSSFTRNGISCLCSYRFNKHPPLCCWFKISRFLPNIYLEHDSSFSQMIFLGVWASRRWGIWGSSFALDKKTIHWSQRSRRIKLACCSLLLSSCGALLKHQTPTRTANRASHCHSHGIINHY
jgi:hypothetical protein